MPKVTIYHFPNWGSSKNALAVAEELGVDHEVVLYIKTPPDRKALQSIIDGLEDPVEDLVRKDSKFKKLELNPDDYVDNPSEISGSTINIHQNSPFLDSDENNEPAFSGSRWKHVIKSK